MTSNLMFNNIKIEYNIIIRELLKRAVEKKDIVLFLSKKLKNTPPETLAEYLEFLEKINVVFSFSFRGNDYLTTSPFYRPELITNPALDINISSNDVEKTLNDFYGTI